MEAARRLYRWLVRRLPPPAAWAVWRAGLLAASARRARVPPPGVRVARVAWGVGEQELGAVVDGLLADAVGPPSEVLVVSDCDAVHVAAARGCRLEHVPPRAGWARAFPGADYDAFLSGRGQAIARAYRIGRLEDGGRCPDALLRGLRDEGAAALSRT